MTQDHRDAFDRMPPLSFLEQAEILCRLAARPAPGDPFAQWARRKLDAIEACPRTPGPRPPLIDPDRV